LKPNTLVSIACTCPLNRHFRTWGRKCSPCLKLRAWISCPPARRFVVICSVGMAWFVALGVYGQLLIGLGVAEDHWLDSGMHGVTFAGYNLVLAGLFTYVCDWCQRQTRSAHTLSLSLSLHARPRAGGHARLPFLQCTCNPNPPGTRWWPSGTKCSNPWPSAKAQAFWRTTSLGFRRSLRRTCRGASSSRGSSSSWAGLRR
jgi:hypothetical protein